MRTSFSLISFLLAKRTPQIPTVPVSTPKLHIYEDPDTKVIQVENLNAFYGSKQVLFDISIPIKREEGGKGTITALIGPSGCGKSTFLKTLNRMNDLVPGFRAEGLVSFSGTDIYHPSVDVVLVRKKIGMIFQKADPFPKSVFDNIAYAPRIAGIKKKNVLAEIVEKSLKRAGLWDEVKDRLKSSALALSGGQQQRLCIARALAADPEVLLMDEPASALDPKATAIIEDLIFELSEQGLPIVIVTHQMQQAARVAKGGKTAFFYLGKVEEFGDTDQIFTKPKHKITEDFITGRFG